MWDLPRPGLEPVSPALAGRLSTTAPPGKPSSHVFNLALVVYTLYGQAIQDGRFLVLCTSPAQPVPASLT